MLDFMERSTAKLLKKRGNSNTEIARILGRDRKTVGRALAEPTDKTYQRSERGSLVDPFEERVHLMDTGGHPCNGNAGESQER